MISDNVVHMNVVLANGTAIDVNATTNPDLWWAMRGAGHNFGVVTSFDLKIHPAEKHPWYYRQYVFTGDRLEALFQELNRFQHNGTSSPQTVAGSFGVYAIDASISTTEVNHCIFRFVSFDFLVLRERA